jgi:predicted nucleotidyltransferase
MPDQVSPTVPEALARTAAAVPGLALLLLFGSRARSETHACSDWDFGYLASARLDAAGLLAALVETTGSDRIDLVDLQRAGGLLRYRAARDGQVVYESQPGVADAFRLEAVRFWCEAAPVLQRGYEAVLAELDR